MQKKRLILKNIFITLTALMITACGSENNNSISVSLSKFKSTKTGPVYSTQLAGIDSNGVSYEGSLSSINQTQGMFNGILFTARDFAVELNDGNNFVIFSSTSYIGSNNNLLSFIFQGNTIPVQLSCTPVTPDNLPSSVNVGDFGDLSILVCSDRFILERNWKVEDANDGNILLIFNKTLKDTFNETILVKKIVYTLSSDGYIIAFKSQEKIISSDYTLTYSSI